MIFVDCDDCLYQNDWATAAKITTSIAAYTASLGVSEEKAYALYKTHGTCLKVTRVALFAFTLTLTRTLALTLALAPTLTLLPQGDA